MKHTQFRPCIDLHEGKVKQIVGGTLSDKEDAGPTENFISDRPASYYAELYKRDALTGGHVIMLGPGNEQAAISALAAYPDGLHLGGGITPDNAGKYLDAGASHVIVTSYLFEGPSFSPERLNSIKKAVGPERLVLDLSCRRTADGWVAARDRWQTLTDLILTDAALDELVDSCAELLVHAADLEGQCRGIDEELVSFLGEWGKLPVTYAGGARSLQDLERVQQLSRGRVDLTIGSALDIFGGEGASYQACVEYNRSSSG